MKTYQFEPTCTINSDSWYINRDYIPMIKIKANNLSEAINKFVDHCGNNYVNISNNAVKAKSEQYNDDDIQNGYVFTASTEMENANGKFVKKYIEVWVTINELINPFV